MANTKTPNVKITYDYYDITNKNSTLKITCDNQDEASTLIEELKKNGLTCIQPSGSQNNCFFIARALKGKTEYGYYISLQNTPSIMTCSNDKAEAIAKSLGLLEDERTIHTYEENATILIKREIPDETQKKIIPSTPSYQYHLSSDKLERLFSRLSKEQQNTISSSGKKRLEEIFKALEITATRVYFDAEKSHYFVDLTDEYADQLFDLLNNNNPPLTVVSIEHTDTETPTPSTEKTQDQDTNQDQYQNNDPISAHQTLLDNCNLIKIQLIDNLSTECTRLNTSGFLTGIGVISTGTDKISALNALKEIITTPDSNLKASLIQWKRNNHNTITKQRNLIHTFFSPAHQTSTLKKVKELFKQLDLDYDTVDSLDTHSPKPSN